MNTNSNKTTVKARLQLITSMAIFGTLAVFVRNISVSSGEYVDVSELWVKKRGELLTSDWEFLGSWAGLIKTRKEERGRSFDSKRWMRYY